MKLKQLLEAQYQGSMPPPPERGQAAVIDLSEMDDDQIEEIDRRIDKLFRVEVDMPEEEFNYLVDNDYDIIHLSDDMGYDMIFQVGDTFYHECRHSGVIRRANPSMTKEKILDALMYYDQPDDDRFF